MKDNQRMLSVSQSLASRAFRRLGPLPLVALAALGTAAPAAGQTFHVQAAAGPGQLDDSTSDWPQYAEYVGTNPKTYQTAWASAGPGLDGCYSISEYYAITGTYASSTADAYFEYDDVVFTSTGTSPTEWVTLNLMLEGDHVVNNAGASVQVKVELQGTWVGTAKATASGIQTTGGLVGYDMTTPLSFQVPFHVQVNTPISMKIGLHVDSTTVYVGDKASAHFRLRLGGAPTPSAAATYNPFTLPAVVTTVNSAQAGIVDNVWQVPEDLYLMPSESTLAPGKTVVLTAWNGTPAQPVGLFVTSIDGVPVPIFLGGSLLSADGAGKFGPIAHDPSLVGHSFGFTSVSLSALGALIFSAEETVSVL